jgi:hypothetical protein
MTAFFCLALVPLKVWAGVEVQGEIVKKGDERRPMNGLIRALPASREFQIRSGQAQLTIQAADVASVRVVKPAALDAAMKQAITQPAAAIPVLKQIVTDYQMLGWDMVAARSLLTAYLKNKQAGEAIKVAEGLIRDSSGIDQDEGFMGAYWDALLEDGKDARVMSSITETIRKGSRPMAAMAHVKRGHILFKQRSFKEALWDGYLRTTELFGSEKSMQPEALYWAAKCFDELAMSSQAEKMRQRLVKAYPTSEFAGMLSGK